MKKLIFYIVAILGMALGGHAQQKIPTREESILRDVVESIYGPGKGNKFKREFMVKNINSIITNNKIERPLITERILGEFVQTDCHLTIASDILGVMQVLEEQNKFIPVDYVPEPKREFVTYYGVPIIMTTDRNVWDLKKEPTLVYKKPSSVQGVFETRLVAKNPEKLDTISSAKNKEIEKQPNSQNGVTNNFNGPVNFYNSSPDDLSSARPVSKTPCRCIKCCAQEAKKAQVVEVVRTEVVYAPQPQPYYYPVGYYQPYYPYSYSRYYYQGGYYGYYNNGWYNLSTGAVVGAGISATLHNLFGNRINNNNQNQGYNSSGSSYNYNPPTNEHHGQNYNNTVYAPRQSMGSYAPSGGGGYQAQPAVHSSPGGHYGPRGR